MQRAPLKELVQNGHDSHLSEPVNHKILRTPMNITDAVTILGRGRGKPQLEATEPSCDGTKDCTHNVEKTTPTPAVVLPKTPLKRTKPG